jgi:hypothetical protein
MYKHSKHLCENFFQYSVPHAADRSLEVSSDSPCLYSVYIFTKILRYIVHMQACLFPGEGGGKGGAHTPEKVTTRLVFYNTFLKIS